MGLSGNLPRPTNSNSSPVVNASGIENLRVDPDSLQSIVFLVLPRDPLPETTRSDNLPSLTDSLSATSAPKALAASIVADMSSERTTFLIFETPWAIAAQRIALWVWLFDVGTCILPLSFPGNIFTLSIFNLFPL